MKPLRSGSGIAVCEGSRRGESYHTPWDDAL